VPAPFTPKTATSLGPLSNIHGSLTGRSQPAHHGVFYTDYGPFPVSYCSLPVPCLNSHFFPISPNPAMSLESAVGSPTRSGGKATDEIQSDVF